MEVGTSIGNDLALLNDKIYIIVIGFILGFVTILAEPADHVLTHQIEDVTSGYVKRNAVLFTLAMELISRYVIGYQGLIPEIRHYLLPDI